MTNRLHRDQTGLIGKALVVWLVILAVFLLVGFDAVSIVFAKYRVADVAGNAASEAAYNYKTGGDIEKACQAAVDYVAAHDASAKIPQAGCAIDKTTGDVTITVRKTANTLIAKRLSFTEDLTHVESTETVPAPI
jgi:uncharacterized membrane protein